MKHLIFTPRLATVAVLVAGLSALMAPCFSYSTTISEGYFIYPFNDFANGNDGAGNIEGLSNLSFNNNSDTVVGDLPQDGTSLLLTDREKFQSRSVFRTIPMPLTNNYEFSTTFAFRIDSPTDDGGGANNNRNKGADGLVFVIHNDPADTGSSGGGIGYADIPNSIGVEFDTWSNRDHISDEDYLDCIGDEPGDRIWMEDGLPEYANGECDSSDNHIGININGNPASVKLLHVDEIPFNAQFVDSGSRDQYDPDTLITFEGRTYVVRDWWVWVDYHAGLLEVITTPVFKNQPKPAKPEQGDPNSYYLSYSVDLQGIMGGLTDAYVGFTSATGSEVNQHEIIYWQFGNTYGELRDNLPPQLKVDASDPFSCNQSSLITLDSGQTMTIRDNDTTENGTDVNDDGFIDYVSGLGSISLEEGAPFTVDSNPSAFEGTMDEVALTFSLIEETVGGQADVTLTDMDGNSCVLAVKVGEIAPPEAIASVYSADTPANSTITVSVNEVVTLDGLASTTGYSYYWDVDAQDGIDSEDYSSVVTNHSYDSVGEYTATLHVYNDEQAVTTAVTIIVTNATPVAVAEVSSATDENSTTPAQISAYIGELLHLDGSKSSDPENTDLQYQWTAEQGSLTDSDAEKATIVFDQVGEYNVTLTVTDANGASHQANVTVYIENQLPTALANVKLHGSELAAAKQITVVAGSKVDFIATGSADLDNQALTYSWVLHNADGDSITTQSGEVASYLLTDQGAYTLSLTVSDGFDTATDTAIINVIVLVPPVAVIDVTDSTGQNLLANSANVFVVNQGATLSFNGLNSQDSDGEIIDYDWAGANAGEQVAQVVRTFNETGRYTVSLTVTDNDDLTATAEVIVVVNEAPYIDISKIEINYGDGEGAISDHTRFTVEGDAVYLQRGASVELDASGSYDDDKIESYVWCSHEAFNADTNSCESVLYEGASYEYTAHGTGTEVLTLIVTDEYGASSSATFLIEQQELDYQASGSVGFSFSALLGLMFWFRRFNLRAKRGNVSSLNH